MRPGSDKDAGWVPFLVDVQVAVLFVRVVTRPSLCPTVVLMKQICNEFAKIREALSILCGRVSFRWRLALSKKDFFGVGTRDCERDGDCWPTTEGTEYSAVLLSQVGHCYGLHSHPGLVCILR